MFVCSFSGKRIPDVDAAGASTGRGFKLGRQASESHRTCCWWCHWPSPHNWWSDLSFPSLYLASPHNLDDGGHQLDGCRKCFIVALNKNIAICCQKYLAKEIFPDFWEVTKKSTTVQRCLSEGPRLYFTCFHYGLCLLYYVRLDEGIVQFQVHEIRYSTYQCVHISYVSTKLSTKSGNISQGYFEPA